MGPDEYKVKVLHYINPYLLWTEVVDSKVVSRKEYVIEQVGIYGIVPLETTIDIEKEGLQTQRSEDWMPAATLLMHKLLSDAVKVKFTPTHIDRRSSIFDDNIHKYGDLIITKLNGKIKSLKKSLIKNGLAEYNERLFHERLYAEKVKTNLTQTQINAVISHIENFYLNEDKEKTAIRKHTTIHNTAQELESALTVENVEALNSRNARTYTVDDYLQSKMHDLNLCRNIDEVSMGRGVQRQKNINRTIEKKLSLLNRGPNDPINMFNVTKQFLTKKAVKKTSAVETSRTDDVKDNLAEDMAVPHHDEEEITPPVPVLKKVSKSKQRNKIPEIDVKNQSRIAFGPPEIDKQHLLLKVVPKNSLLIDEVDKPNTTEAEGQVPMPVEEDMYGNVDSDVDLEYSPKVDKNVVKTVTANTSTPKNKKTNEDNSIELTRNLSTDTDKSSIGAIKTPPTSAEKVAKAITANTSTPENKKTREDNSIELTRNRSTDTDKSSIGVIKTPPNSTEKENKSGSVLKKKLRLYKKTSPRVTNSFSSNSDTSIKDSSTSVEDAKPKPFQPSTDLDSDDDSAAGVLESINKEYPQQMELKQSPQHTEYTEVRNYVNPFKNIDPNISVFVDKLVTPILMVHSKNDKRIQSTFEIRDKHFSTHIHVALKNFGIGRPMTIQTVSWLTILRGYSTFMISPQGSGKTMGYIPAVCRLVSDSSNSSPYVDSVGPICIIICATANSASHVEKLARMFLTHNDRVFTCISGLNELDIATSLLNGCDLLICTPSILVRLLQNTDFGVDLRRLTMFVLDDCERLSDVYMNEVKFFFAKIKEMLKSRAAKELKVQYVLASRIWCDFMAPLANKAPNTVISIGAFQECVLYSKSKMSATFVAQENKVSSVLEFLNTVDVSKKTVIVCRFDDEVETVQKALKNAHYVVFACDNTMTVQDLYNVSLAWNDYEEPLSGPILVCCDNNLTHMNVTDAHNLIHYSLPSLFSLFCKRFCALNDNYPAIFQNSNDNNVNIKILLDDTNTEQLPKILHFIKRCTDDVPKVLDEVCEKVLKEKDVFKATKMVPVCDNMLALGHCPDFWNCQSRHVILTNYDEPKDCVPKEGEISFKIIHYHNAVLYSARLLSNTVNGQVTKYTQTYKMLSMKLATYFAKESNKRLHGIPKVGDICAVSVRQNFFVRCQVVKIINKYQNGNPNSVLVKLIDEEKFERSRDIYLYYLPEEMKHVETNAVQVRLANIQPKDKDITFSRLAVDHLKSITDTNDDFYLKGVISLTIGNCILLDNLELCRDLSSLSKTVVVICLFRKELELYATDNPDHIPSLKKLCEDGGMTIKQKRQVQESVKVKQLPKGRWAHLDANDMNPVYFASADDTSTFFIRLAKFEDCMNILLKDIQKYIAENTEVLTGISVGDVVLAKFPDDGIYERARIDKVHGEQVKCFFVDQGDWRDVNKKDLTPITEKLITQLPYQAIECRLVGVKPRSETWTEFSTNWFINFLEDNSGNLKQIFAKYFKKEPAKHTGGHKYAVVLIDTNSNEDVVVNTTMIDLNLASEDDDEIDYLAELDFQRVSNKYDSSDDEVDWEKVSTENAVEKQEGESTKVSLNDIFLKKPVHSVPLIGSDDSDLDDFDLNMTDEFMNLLGNKGQGNANVQVKSQTNLPALEAPLANGSRTDSANDLQMIPSPKLQTIDSDDLTSPDQSQVNNSADNSPEKNSIKDINIKTEETKSEVLIGINDLRTPKVTWRQTNTDVFIKILLIGAENYNLKIDDNNLKFDAIVNDIKYGFDFNLYGVVDSKSSVHSDKGQYIYINMKKVVKSKWLKLNKTGFKKFISYDTDHIDDVDDDDIDFIDDTQNLIKSLNKEESDTDDDFLDDANHRIYR